MELESKQQFKEVFGSLFCYEDEHVDYGIYQFLKNIRDSIKDFINSDVIEKIEESVDTSDLFASDEKKNSVKTKTYKILYNFFSRYFHKGDFISRRRYSKDNKYIIPYNGEETFFTWANYDQYYVKASRLLKLSQKNKTDYFVHKDLKPFLHRELDFFIKNELLEDALTNLTQADTYKEMVFLINLMNESGGHIIEYLAHIENLQRNLWLKPKFVLDTQYLITVDRIPEEFHEEIVANPKQIAEWKRLYSLTISSKAQLKIHRIDGVSYLKLPVDTILFNTEFKERLLTALSEEHNLDDIIDGILINSDNFHALTLLTEKYRGSVKSIYIDPPYNTGNANFIFEDRYPQSTWLTMMENRLRLAKNLMREDGNILVSIDHNELTNLTNLMNTIFGEENFIETFVWTKTLTPPSLALKSRKSIEYILCYEKNKTNTQYKGVYTQKAADQPLLNTANPNKRITFPAGSVSIKFPDGIYKAEAYPKAKVLKDFRVKDQKVVDDLVVEIRSKWSQEKVLEEVGMGTRFIIKSDKFSIRFIRVPTDGFRPPKNFIYAKKGEGEADVGTNETSTKQIKAYGIDFKDYPKPAGLVKFLLGFNTEQDDLIIDFFAGSGTTGQAVIDLNHTKKREGNRKYILIELEHYFDSVLKERIAKCIFSRTWDKGKPKDKEGVSHIVKYMYLEQFDDTIHNLSLKDAEDTDAQMHPENFQDYYLKYIWDQKSKDDNYRLSINQFSHPFQYSLELINGDSPLDLMETFNHLLGIRVKKQIIKFQEERKYYIVKGTLRDEEIVIIWRNTRDIDLYKDKTFIEGEILSLFQPSKVYLNGNSSIEGVYPIEPEFKRLMARN
ncbi:MAG: site-specific DNA-methyltransferase [Promethearchaeota archaeon]